MAENINEFMPVYDRFSTNIYTGLLQFQHDHGLTSVQEAVRLLVARSLNSEGYPKASHKIKLIK